MGFVKHHAIVVTCWDSAGAKVLRDKAVALGLNPTEITEPAVNGYISFLIPPDGNKEGWTTSDEFDEKRAEFRLFIRDCESRMRSEPFTMNGPRLWCEWVEVSFGDDPESAEISNSKWSGSK